MLAFVHKIVGTPERVARLQRETEEVREAQKTKSIRTRRGTVRVGMTWDEAVPYLPERIGLERRTPDMYEDTRRMEDGTRVQFIFARPTTYDGPYTLRMIRKLKE
jgi:hypothetical protein